MNRRGMAIMLSVFVCAMALVAWADNASAFNLPDTGQTKCYNSSGVEISDCTGTGQDGAYSINPLSYTDNGNTVTDNNTGLMWQKQDDGTARTWADAVAYCSSSSIGDYTGWRLPSKKELVTIVDYSIASSGPAISTTYFPGTKTAQPYWTTTALALDTTSAWNVSFQSGAVGTYDKSALLYVRCVRTDQVEQSFTDNGDGTVTENRTGLMWQQADPGAQTWDNALGYCGSLVLPSTDGYSDWRLPNVKELESITDDARYNPNINKTYFPNAKSSAYYWTSTTYVTTPGRAWCFGTFLGEITNCSKGSSTSLYVRCVRGGPVGPFAQLVHNGSLFNTYATIQDAYGHAAEGDTIKAQARSSTETLAFASNISIALKGGYDSDFASNSGMTVVSGVLTVNGGTVTIENVTIK